MQKINTKVLMSGAEFFSAEHPINSYMHAENRAQPEKAIAEHDDIKQCFEQAGIEIITEPAPVDCQDGVYTANWALTRGNKAVMANLPNKRQDEEPVAEAALRGLGFEIVKLPREIHFSGQGDALPCGNFLLAGTTYRTSLEAHQMVADALGYEVISLQTVPEFDSEQNPVTNAVTGWPDSFFYDIDLAISVLRPNLIAWCPEAFVPESQEKIRALEGIDKIEVSLEEATQASACNLVSTGESVVMSSRAPKLKKAIEDHGFTVYTPDVTELMKGGGFIRCTSLTLNNI